MEELPHVGAYWASYNAGIYPGAAKGDLKSLDITISFVIPAIIASRDSIELLDLGIYSSLGHSIACSQRFSLAESPTHDTILWYILHIKEYGVVV